MEEWKEKLKAGREIMALKCQEVAAKYTPADCKVVYRKSLTGHADYKERVLSAPRPVTRKSLYIYLHECAHFHLEHGVSKPKKHRHIEEMEAERWAHDRMRENGIAVPRSMTKRAKEYVAYKVSQAEKRGLKRVDGEVKKYIGRQKKKV